MKTCRKRSVAKTGYKWENVEMNEARFTVDGSGSTDDSRAEDPRPDDSGESRRRRRQIVVQVGEHAIPLVPGASAMPAEDGRWFFVDRAANRVCDVETGEWTQLDPGVTPDDFLRRH